jgi:hypothetical protein
VHPPTNKEGGETHHTVRAVARRRRGASVAVFPVGDGVPVVLTGEGAILEHRGGKVSETRLKKKSKEDRSLELTEREAVAVILEWNPVQTAVLRRASTMKADAREPVRRRLVAFQGVEGGSMEKKKEGVKVPWCRLEGGWIGNSEI